MSIHYRVKKFQESEIELTGQFLGQGRYAVVSKVTIGGRYAALKVYKEEGFLEAVDEVNTFTKLRHVNIIRLMGILHKDFSKEPRVLLEYMPGGSLKIYLQMENLSEGSELEHIPIKWSPKESIEWKVLHNRSGKYSTASDVWAFGVTMFEIFTGGNDPYTATDFGGTQGQEDVANAIYMDASPITYLTPPVSEQVVSIMRAIFKSNPSDRPSFVEIRRMLEVQISAIGSVDAPMVGLGSVFIDDPITHEAKVNQLLQSGADESIFTDSPNHRLEETMLIREIFSLANSKEIILKFKDGDEFINSLNSEGILGASHYDYLCKIVHNSSKLAVLCQHIRNRWTDKDIPILKKALTASKNFLVLQIVDKVITDALANTFSKIIKRTRLTSHDSTQDKEVDADYEMRSRLSDLISSSVSFFDNQDFLNSTPRPIDEDTMIVDNIDPRVLNKPFEEDFNIAEEIVKKYGKNNLRVSNVERISKGHKAGLKDSLKIRMKLRRKPIGRVAKAELKSTKSKMIEEMIKSGSYKGAQEDSTVTFVGIQTLEEWEIEAPKPYLRNLGKSKKLLRLFRNLRVKNSKYKHDAGQTGTNLEGDQTKIYQGPTFPDTNIHPHPIENVDASLIPGDKPSLSYLSQMEAESLSPNMEDETVADSFFSSPLAPHQSSDFFISKNLASIPSQETNIMGFNDCHSAELKPNSDNHDSGFF
ncbi:uncharacterized protein LOC118435815 [Folsomia candida]|uniref:uncharacterized protein LOC118435815 n=1 Tax=Folsomia candida TaxID=158441 RepID=UPI00160511CD|nr:uncharacterized protein LOC118435815 [Folsomia candida]